MTGTDAEFNRRLLATFRDEAEENLGGMVNQLIRLETAGPSADPSCIEQIYRSTHSLKGAARAVGQREIELVCQNLENVFSRMKKGDYIADAAAFDIFHEAVKVIQSLLRDDTSLHQSPTKIIAAIRSISRKGTDEGDLPGDIPAPGTVVPEPAVSPCPGKSTETRKRKAKSKPPATSSSPIPTPDYPPGGRTWADLSPTPMDGFSSTGVTGSGTVRIAAHKLDRLISGSDDLLTTRLFMTHRMQELEDLMARFTLWRWNQATISSDIHHIRESSFGAQKGDLPADLVLPLQRLAEFLDYNREFVTYLQHDLNEHIRATERDRSALEASTIEISDLIHDAVLQPVASILTPFPGLVREYSRNTGKKVELVTEGGEIEVDRRILDSLRYPLMHLVYNSIDHGIEYPDIRATGNKPPSGTVRIKVFPLSGGKAGIEVSDDGAGIDARLIRKEAVRAGIITAKEAAGLSDSEAIWLIFRSGLSTNSIITEISGRGLGLAIVEDTVTRLGGFVTIASEPGKGTSISLRVPVRLVTFRGVVVRSGNQVYVLPMQQVQQVLRVKPDAILLENDRSVIPFNNEMIGVLRLDAILGEPTTGPITDKEGQVSLVIIAYGAGQVACLVDEVIRVQEIVVRPLGSQLRRVKRIAGAAILGDGTLALVLDPPELIQEALKAGGISSSPAQSVRSASRVLVVEDSVTSRTFLQMLLERDGYEVMTAADGVEAFALLKEQIPDIVVSDVDMPRMNGFVLTEKIRGDIRLSSLPVVLVTSLDAADDQRHGLAVGADAYIVKSSFEKTELLDVIRNLVEAQKRSHGA